MSMKQEPVSQRAAQVTAERRRLRRSLDVLVGFRILATLGALIAAVAPAVMASADGSTLRGSVSAYWNIPNDVYFEVPFTAAAALLAIDGALSYSSPNKNIYGKRWFNIVLATALFVLTWWNTDDHTTIHYIAAAIFFGLFILVIFYTTALAWLGQTVAGAADVDEHAREKGKIGAEVAGAFLVLLVLTLIGFWPLGIVSFFFFEVFALVNFALFYVQGLVQPFPYRYYEFPWSWLNALLRAVRIMPSEREQAIVQLVS